MRIPGLLSPFSQCFCLSLTLLPFTQSVCLSLNAFAFQLLPFNQCFCLSLNAFAFQANVFAFQSMLWPFTRRFCLSLNASVFHCEWQDLYLIQCTCQVNPHSSVQQELLATVCTAVMSCSVKNIYSLSHVPAHCKGGGQGDGVQQQVAGGGGGGGHPPPPKKFYQCKC